MRYLTCTIISSADLTRNRIFCAKDWVSEDCNTISYAIKLSENAMITITRLRVQYFVE